MPSLPSLLSELELKVALIFAFITMLNGEIEILSLQLKAEMT